MTASLSQFMKRDQDQYYFEKYLSAPPDGSSGAVFNGSSDDAPAIQAALNTMGSDNKFHEVALPSGGLTAIIGTINTCSYADPLALSSPPNAGLVIPSNIGLNLNLITLQVSAAGATALGATGVAVAYAGNSNITNAFPVHMVSWGHGTILANGIGYGLLLGNGGGDRGPDRLTTRNLRVSNGINGMKLGDTTYLAKFYDSYFSCTTTNNVLINNTAGGENNAFICCTFDHEGASSGSSSVTGLLVQSQSDTFLYACSFDFLNTAIATNASATPVISVVGMGCHLEMNKANANWDANSGYLRIFSNAGAKQSINMFGGQIIQDTGGTGTQLAQICRSGVTGAAAPYGITLDRVGRALQGGTTINLNTDTGRFVDNP